MQAPGDVCVRLRVREIAPAFVHRAPIKMSAIHLYTWDERGLSFVGMGDAVLGVHRGVAITRAGTDN